MEVVNFFLQHIKPAMTILAARPEDHLEGSIATVMADRYGLP